MGSGPFVWCPKPPEHLFKTSKDCGINLHWTFGDIVDEREWKCVVSHIKIVHCVSVMHAIYHFSSFCYNCLYQTSPLFSTWPKVGWLYVVQYIIIRFSYIHFVREETNAVLRCKKCANGWEPVWLSKVGWQVASEIHACAIKKLKKLNCNFIVPFDRFPASFVAAKLFVTVALSSHCCRATCEHMIADTHRNLFCENGS